MDHNHSLEGPNVDGTSQTNAASANLPGRDQVAGVVLDVSAGHDSLPGIKIYWEAADPNEITQRLPKVAVIVPAYNEQSRISRVLSVVKQVQQIDEIIVVDDGSSDQTYEEAIQAARGDGRFRVLRHETNRGKGQALYTGWLAARAPYLILIDADLTNLQPQHLIDLMQPVVQDGADMSMGLFRGGYWRADLGQILTPWLTGQRCLRRELLQDISWKAAAGYGFETALTLVAGRQGWRQVRVPLRGVSHVMGDRDQGSWRGPLNKAKMFAHIARAWWELEEWQGLLPQMVRRVRFLLVLVVTLGLGMFNSCSLTATDMPRRIVWQWMSNDNFWLWVGKLKTTLDMLP